MSGTGINGTFQKQAWPVTQDKEAIKRILDSIFNETKPAIVILPPDIIPQNEFDVSQSAPNSFNRIYNVDPIGVSSLERVETLAPVILGGVEKMRKVSKKPIVIDPTFTSTGLPKAVTLLLEDIYGNPTKKKKDETESFLEQME